MMTLGLHLDLVGQADLVVLHFSQAPEQEVAAAMEVQAEWVAAWASWEAPEDQVAASLDGGLRLAHRQMPDLTTN